MYTISGAILALMKIIHDYENYGKTSFLVKDLHAFCKKVEYLANKTGEGPFILRDIGEVARPLDLICNISISDGYMIICGRAIPYNGDCGLKQDSTIMLDINKFNKNEDEARRAYLVHLSAVELRIAYDVLKKEKNELKQKNNKEQTPAKLHRK